VEEVQNVDGRGSERIAKMKLQATRKRMKMFGILIKAKTRNNLKRKKMIATKVLKRRNVLPREEESSLY
jgi:hypothetical protein